MIEITIKNTNVKFLSCICQAKIKYPAEFRGKNKVFGNVCGRHATYKLDGVMLCKRHAQEKALDMLTLMSIYR